MRFYLQHFFVLKTQMCGKPIILLLIALAVAKSHLISVSHLRLMRCLASYRNISQHQKMP